MSDDTEYDFFKLRKAAKTYISKVFTFTLAEAVEDQIDLEIGCRSCGQAINVDLTHLQGTAEPPDELWQIKLNGFWKREPCTACGLSGRRYVQPRVL